MGEVLAFSNRDKQQLCPVCRGWVNPGDLVVAPDVPARICRECANGLALLDAIDGIEPA